MTGIPHPAAQSLTGVWHGIYTYPRGDGVSFVATLIETASAVTGTIHEPCATSPGDTLFATLAGGRADSAVAFVKTYDGSNPSYRVVEYEGTLSGDGCEIEGRWIVPGSWSGRFLMIRPHTMTAAVLRTAFERT